MRCMMTAFITMFLLSGCYTLNEEHYNSVVETPAKVEQLKKSDEQMKQDIRLLKEAVSRLKNNMTTEIHNEAAAVIQPTETSVKVTLQQSLLFDSGSSDISGLGREALVKFAEAIAHASSSANIRIIGHTDSQPVGTLLRASYTDNWELSAARAAAVARFLVWGANIEANRIHIEGSAGTQPIASNDTEKGRAQNRRIELLVQES